MSSRIVDKNKLSKDIDNGSMGVVIETLPNVMFKVRLEDGEEIVSTLSGKMRIHRIKILMGDKVLLLLDPYGGKARILKRL